MKNTRIALPARVVLALPRRGTRPRTQVDRIKDKLDPLLMARTVGVLVEPGGRR